MADDMDQQNQVLPKNRLFIELKLTSIGRRVSTFLR